VVVDRAKRNALFARPMSILVCHAATLHGKPMRCARDNFWETR
jgi:hypothetical protein